MNETSTSTATANPLYELQQTLYSSSNYTRRRLHQTRRHWVENAIAEHAACIPSSRAIEYGPGSGIYLPILARHCLQVTAADIERAYLSEIEPLRQQFKNLSLIEDDIQNSSLVDDSYGLILCSEVLEHVPDPEEALKTLYRILQPGGIAIVTTPQRYSLMELCCNVAFLPGVIDVVRWIYGEPVLPTGHISLRSAPDFRRAIAQAGFDVVEQEKFALYVPVLAEFGSNWGGRLIEWLEARLHGTPLDHAFWTQAYVLCKPRR